MSISDVARAFVEGKRRTIGNASTDGHTYWLFGNPIATKGDGVVKFSTCGYRTQSTRRHMNHIASAGKLGGYISMAQRGGVPDEFERPAPWAIAAEPNPSGHQPPRTQCASHCNRKDIMEFSLDDVRTLEEDEGASPEAEALALQRAINSGMWSLQGSYGRAMMGAIEAGDCMLGEKPARDYFGNYIPSRDQVAEHTKGHRSFVVDRRGEEWAVMLEGA